MSLVSRAIANLFNGISQQPATLRSPNQAELSENCYPSIATGNRKRPPTVHVSNVSGTADSNAFIHWIYRDGTERYEVRIRNGGIEVWNINTGVQQTVNTPDGVGYLASSSPKTDFCAVTIADYTIIVNKAVTAQMTASTTAGSITSTKQKFSDLAAGTNSGNIYQIQGDPTNSFLTYYVKDNGAYVECAKPGILYQIDATTMPFQLVRTGVGVFSFQKSAWTNRLVGDDTSCPLPSFIGQTITDVFFHRNRLGFLSKDNLTMSRAGSYFNFFPSSAQQTLDTDPIDKSAVHTKVALLKSAVAFNGSLLIFSDQTQFQLTGGVDGTLTPKNAKLSGATEFDSDSTVRPVGAGQYVYFTVSKGDWSSVREYFVDDNNVSNDAADVTAHCPTYVPGGVYNLRAATTEDLVVALTSLERNAFYCYKYYWTEDSKKMQSAWFKMTLDSGDSIMGAQFYGTKLYLAVDRADGHHIEYIDFQPNLTDSGLAFLINLDRKVSLTGTYDAANDWTTWTLPYSDAGSFSVVLGSAWGTSSGNQLTTSRPAGTTIRASGDWSAHAVWAGRNYTSRYRFSEFFAKDADNLSIMDGDLKVMNLIVSYDKTGYFRAEVTPSGSSRQTYKYAFSGKKLGTTSSTIGTPSIASGKFRFPVVADSREVVIDIVNDTYLPCSLLSAEWAGEFTTRSRRM